MKVKMTAYDVVRVRCTDPSIMEELCALDPSGYEKIEDLVFDPNLSINAMIFLAQQLPLRWKSKYNYNYWLRFSFHLLENLEIEGDKLYNQFPEDCRKLIVSAKQFFVLKTKEIFMLQQAHALEKKLSQEHIALVRAGKTGTLEYKINRYMTFNVTMILTSKRRFDANVIFAIDEVREMLRFHPAYTKNKFDSQVRELFMTWVSYKAGKKTKVKAQVA